MKKVISFLNGLEEIILGSILLGMVLLGLLQIFYRNILSISLFWIDPLMRHAVLWIALLGASTAAREDRHISIDLLSGRSGPRSRSVILGGIYLFSAAICFVLIGPAVRFVLSEYQVGKTLALKIPIWVSQSIIPVMLVIIGLRFIGKAWTSLFSKANPLSSHSPNLI
jgi:TRAP-type C4-dicarboxylate transport system permease small subunit